ncbi:phytanoyl-CoA dioxygenase family protein [Paenibacillus sp. GCM10023252]|uniref:phytanoyl-CoA dioxygenase family protein n=1 Tax=Paenibacillus sp. GCM10023252 TaxID=3252649 RepID=UPI00361C9A6E
MAEALTPEQISEKLYRFDRVADKLERLSDIGEEALKQYQTQGFLGINKALSEQEVSTAIAAIVDIITYENQGAKLQYVKPLSELPTIEDRELALRKIYDFTSEDGNERLKAIANHPSILAAAEKILGEKPKLVQDMALLKPPHGGGEKPWHQDMAYGNLAYDKSVVGVWIALDDADLDNGCMHVIPGSHAGGAIPHYAIRDWQICDLHVPVERDVAVPLPSGGLMLFHGLLSHGTPYNHSVKRRRALQFHYVGESAVRLSPKEYKRFFTNEMTGAEC